MHAAKLWAAGLLVALCASSGRHAVADPAATVLLASPAWTVELEPGSLAVTARPLGGPAVRLSAPQRDLGPVTDLAFTETEVSWLLAERSCRVALRLAGDTLEARFQATGPTEITWPAIGSDVSVRAHIVPLFEGSYIPADHAEWLSFLAEQSPMSTTEGLSMPFLGIDAGERTITYIFANPFHNSLAFRGHEGRITADVTHVFTERAQGDDYVVVVGLGPPSPIEPARRYRRYLVEQGDFITLRDKIKRLPEAEKLLGAAHAYLWGDGLSVKMMEDLAALGLDRLWLGLDSWQGGFREPEAVKRAKELGWLIASYDSYESIHSPDETDTWETAQFDRRLYESGGVIGRDGKPMRGFQGKGYRLNPLVAKPYVRERVNRLMGTLPERFNSWFIDCDAYGDLDDDYSLDHPMTQRDDMEARLERMAWIRDAYQLAIGSERGAAYAAPVIHFAHGMMTPVIGWGDPDLQKDKQSPYYLGAWWPPEGPGIMVKQVPLKPRCRTPYFDPRFRLPLYQTAFHDSLVTTHHWQYASLKFTDQLQTVELLELLYNVPPLYHLNLKELAKHKERIAAHYRFFSPLHRELATEPLTDFEWLSPDHLVQRTVFGDPSAPLRPGGVEMVANFSEEAFSYQGTSLPPNGILARCPATGAADLFVPASAPEGGATPDAKGARRPQSPLLSRPRHPDGNGAAQGRHNVGQQHDPRL